MQPLLQRLMNNPAHSVEHIEKQQRAVTPQDQSQNTSVSVLFRSKAKHELTKNTTTIEMFKRRSVSPKTFREMPTPNSSIKSAANNSERSAPIQSSLENGFNFMRISSPSSGSPRGSYYLQQTEDTEVRTMNSPNSFLETSQKPALMPPMMFTSSVLKEKDKESTHGKTNETTADIMFEPLNRKQLVQAFHYLLKNDPEFVTKLHEAYVKSFTEIIS